MKMVYSKIVCDCSKAQSSMQDFGDQISSKFHMYLRFDLSVFKIVYLIFLLL